MDVNFYLIIFVASFAITAMLTGIVLILAKTWSIMDVPNERSAHIAPTPRGGGVGFVVVILVALLVFWLLDLYSGKLMASLMLCSGSIALLGLWDDFSNLPAKFRLLFQFVISAAFVANLEYIPQLMLWQWQIPLVISTPLFVVTLVWLTNLYNFMDGIDGLAAMQGLCAVLIIGLLSVLLSQFEWVPILACVAGAMIGFLCWNWQPAKIFMGDVGSGFLGFLLGGLALLSAETIGLWPWLMALALFIVDTGVTLLVRLLSRQNVFDAHQSHLYQQLARYLQSHSKVCFSFIVFTVLWLLPMALLAISFTEYMLLIGIVTYLPLTVVGLRYSLKYYELSFAMLWRKP